LNRGGRYADSTPNTSHNLTHGKGILMPRNPQVQDLPRLELHERSRYRAAADYARLRYPGAVGELIHRELRAYAEFGHRFARDALVPRLAADILTQPRTESKPMD
jgi:hypothetical protein